MNQEKIGEFIAKLRQEKGLTQTELGDMLGVSYKAVSKWERGINLPDSSLYKPLCDIFNITIDELMEGELKSKTKSKKFIFIPLIIIIILIVIIIMYLNKEKYPNVTIDEIEITKTNDNKLVNQLYPTDDNIWFYNISKLEICTRTFTCYNLSTVLEHKQITMNELKEYYHNQYILNGIEKIVLRDGGTTIYKLNDYMVIFCNNLNGVKDVYFGTLDLENKLAGNYCSHNPSITKYFTRTYKVLNIYPDDDDNYLNVSLSQFQNGIAMVKIPSSYNLEINKTYEFTFYTYKIFDDTIENIFNESTIYSIEETSKVGLEQLQESIYVTKE